ncbi:hypothetical protein AwPolaro_02190 [Polaromonas sp.]|nr:hypothetical protein AwPolaro_02190 [Polaromonas sp.]
MISSSPNPDATVTHSLMPLDAYDELEDILHDLRSRYDETPSWDFCEGFMAALICSRQPITQSDYMAVLLALPVDGEEPDADSGSFSSSAQRERFFTLWHQRWNEISAGLDTDDDENGYQPCVQDLRGSVADLPPEEQAQIKDTELPSFAQVWAIGFMFAVESWPEEWQAPRDKDAALWLDGALNAILTMAEDDTGKPEVSALTEDGAPSVSLARLDAFDQAILAVYDLRELWKTMGPRIEPVRKTATPGRNEACSCGSGKKYKKCCGA